VTPTEVLLGTSSAATGVMEFPGATDFASSYLRMVNDQGGVNGRKFRYIVYDQDATDSNRAIANVRRLNEENKVFAFVGGAHPFSDNIYPYLEEHGAPFFGSMAEIAQQYKRKNTFPAGLYRSMECRFPGEYLVKDRKWQKTAIFKFNVYISEDCAQGVKASLKHYGASIAYENVSAIGQPDYTAEVAQARQAGVDSIFCATDGGTCVRIMQAAQRQGWKPNGGFASCSPCYSATVAKNMAQYADGSYVAAFVSHLWTSSNPGARLMVDTVKKYAPNARYDGAGLPAWTGTNFFVDGLRAIGNDVSRSRLMGWAASQKAWAPQGDIMPPLDWTRLGPNPWYRVPSMHGLLAVMKNGDMQELTGFIRDPAGGDPRPERADW
jgi:branched-chain amino acid transport system substrate-binding protein